MALARFAYLWPTDLAGASNRTGGRSIVPGTKRLGDAAGFWVGLTCVGGYGRVEGDVEDVACGGYIVKGVGRDRLRTCRLVERVCVGYVRERERERERERGSGAPLGTHTFFWKTHTQSAHIFLYVCVCVCDIDGHM